MMLMIPAEPSALYFADGLVMISIFSMLPAGSCSNMSPWFSAVSPDDFPFASGDDFLKAVEGSGKIFANEVYNDYKKFSEYLKDYLQYREKKDEYYLPLMH